MEIQDIQWVDIGNESYGPATCSGTTVAVSSGREMKCSRPATVWRVLVLDDDAEVPKPLCDDHQVVEEEKWEAVRAGTFEKSEDKTTTTKAKKSAKVAERAAAINKERKAKRGKVMGTVTLCEVCAKRIDKGEMYCEGHQP